MSELKALLSGAACAACGCLVHAESAPLQMGERRLSLCLDCAGNLPVAVKKARDRAKDARDLAARLEDVARLLDETGGDCLQFRAVFNQF